MKTQNGRSLARSRAMDCCQTWNDINRYVKGGLGETQ